MALLFDSWFLELGAVLVVLLVGFYLYLQHSFQYWKNKGIPYLEPSFPFGNLTDLALQRTSIGEAFRTMYVNLAGHKLGGIYQLNRPSLLLRDPDLIKTFLVKDFAHFHNHGIYFNEEVDPLSAHLFSLEGVRWKHMRYKLTPTFTSGKMKMMFPTLVKCGKELRDHLAPMARNKLTVEVRDILAKYSTDVIATCAFGIQSNCLKNPDSEFRRMGKKAFEPSVMQAVRELLQLLAPKLASVIKMPSVPHDVSEFFIDIVKTTIEHREKFKVSRNDFIQLLMNIKNTKNKNDPIGNSNDDNEGNKDDQKLSDRNMYDVNGKTMDDQKLLEKNMYDVNGLTMNEIAAQAFVFFVAGFETSSTTISFCLYELALNQDIQDRLRDEVDSVMADHRGELTYEAVLKMQYMDNVVAETLRKYPPAQMLLRSCTKEYQLPGTKVTVERGTPVIIPVYALHHDPQYYPNPEEFDPDRFTEEAKGTRHHFAYLPFGEGPRNCIGSRFALMQTKIGIASFISSYQVNVCKKLTPISPLVMDSTFLLTVKGGMHLQITER